MSEKADAKKWTNLLMKGIEGFGDGTFATDFVLASWELDLFGTVMLYMAGGRDSVVVEDNEW